MDWELKFMQWGNGWWTSVVLDTLVPWLTHLGSQVAVVVFILVSWIAARRRKVLYGLLILFGIQSIIVYGLKFLIQRQRPPFAMELASRFSRAPENAGPELPQRPYLGAFMMATLLARGSTVPVSSSLSSQGSSMEPDLPGPPLPHGRDHGGVLVTESPDWLFAVSAALNIPPGWNPSITGALATSFFPDDTPCRI